MSNMHQKSAQKRYHGPDALEPLIRRRTPRRLLISELASERLGLDVSSDHHTVYRRIDAIFGHRFADDLAAHPEDLEAWEDLQKLEGLAPKTIAKHRSFLSTLFRHAIATGAAPINPVFAMTRKTPAKSRDRARAKLEVMAPGEVNALCFDERLPWWRRVAWRFFLLTGAREGEGQGAQHRDYVPPSRYRCGEILIARQWSSKKHRFTETKTDEIRHVPAHPLWDETYAWARACWRAQVGSEPSPESPLLPYFRGRSRRPKLWSARSILRWWHRDLATCGVVSPAAGPRRLHATRHTFITTLVREGAPEQLVRSMTHADAEARDAFRRYIHAEWFAMAKAIRLLPFGEEARRAS